METSLFAELKVGIFVAAGLLVLLGSILLFGGNKFLLSDNYVLHAKFSEVQGLASGSVVSLSGIPVGNIKKINFSDSSDQLTVTMLIEKQFRTRITEGSMASIKTQGALGDRYIYIEPGDSGRPAIPAQGWIETRDNAGFIDVMTDDNSGAEELVGAIKQLNQLLTNLNQDGRSAALMKNMVDTSDNLNKLMLEVRSLIRDIRGSSKKDNQLRENLNRLASILRKVDEGKGTLGTIINDPSLHDKLMSLLGEAPRNKFLKPLIRATIQKTEEKQ